MVTSIDRHPAITKDFLLRVQTEGVDGWSIVHKFGANNAISSVTSPVCSDGVYETPTTGQALELISDSADDTAAGIGAQSITIYGLDENWDKQEMTTATNGTTAVQISGLWTRMFKIRIGGSGSYSDDTVGPHAGNITIRGTGSGPTWGTMELLPSLGNVASGASLIGVYTIPMGHRGWLIGKKITIESNKLTSVALFHREGCDVVTPPYTPRVLTEIDIGLNTGSSYQPQSPMGPFIGPCDIGFMARVATSTAAVEVDFELLIQKI